jgi:high-affinity nickel-transport protein
MLAPLAVTLFTGALMGVRHATDSDHVVAVTTIVSRERSVWSAGGIGALWGVGHSTTLLVVGGLLIAFKLAMPPRLGLAMSLVVGLMLLALGALNLFGRGERQTGRLTTARPVLIGIVHGLDGSAAIALAAVLQVGNATSALAYLGIFGVGTLVGMMLVTAAIALPSLYATRRIASLQRHLRLASGVLSVTLGGYLVHRATVVDGLFSAVPRWTPE